MSASTVDNISALMAEMELLQAFESQTKTDLLLEIALTGRSIQTVKLSSILAGCQEAQQAVRQRIKNIL